MKINYRKIDNRIKIVSVQELKIGQLAIIVDDGKYSNYIVLRTYNSLISLNDPQFTWSMDLPTFTVRILNDNEVIELSNE